MNEDDYEYFDDEPDDDGFAVDTSADGMVLFEPHTEDVHLDRKQVIQLVDQLQSWLARTAEPTAARDR